MGMLLLRATKESLFLFDSIADVHLVNFFGFLMLVNSLELLYIVILLTNIVLLHATI